MIFTSNIRLRNNYEAEVNDLNVPNGTTTSTVEVWSAMDFNLPVSAMSVARARSEKGGLGHRNMNEQY